MRSTDEGRVTDLELPRPIPSKGNAFVHGVSCNNLLPGVNSGYEKEEPKARTAKLMHVAALAVP